MEWLGTMIVMIGCFVFGYFMSLMVHYGDKGKYYKIGTMHGEITGSMKLFRTLKPVMESEEKKLSAKIKALEDIRAEYEKKFKVRMYANGINEEIKEA